MKPQDIYILNQPEMYRDMLMHVISIIENEMPESSLEFKWKIPFFYYKKKPFCFLNASHKGKFVDVVFSKGYQLKNNLDVLIGENRNTYKSVRYFSLEEIDNEILKSIIREAKELS